MLPRRPSRTASRFFVTPQDSIRSPRAIGPFHIVDEAYKRMWISPRVRPLLIDRQSQQRHVPGLDRPLCQRRESSRSSSATATRLSAIPPTGPSSTTPSSGRRDASSDGRIRGQVYLRTFFSPSMRPTERGNEMKLGLYSITYLGLWYRGEALPLPEMITRAKKFGYDGIEIDGKRPHGNPLDWPAPGAASCVRLPTAKGSRSSPWRPTTTSAIPFPRFARPRSASCAT